MSNREKTLEEIALLSGEISHHVNNPLSVALATVSSIERIISELDGKMPAREREELKEMLDDMNLGLKRISRVVQRLTALSFRLARPEFYLGDPFDTK